MRSIEILEIHVAHGCNLSCESCSHFAGNGLQGLVSLEEAETWMSALEPAAAAQVLRTLGRRAGAAPAPGAVRLAGAEELAFVPIAPASNSGNSSGAISGSVRRLPTCNCRRRHTPRFRAAGTLTWPTRRLPRAARRPNSIGSSPARRKGSVPCARPHRRFSRSLHRWPRLIHRVADCGAGSGSGEQGVSNPLTPTTTMSTWCPTWCAPSPRTGEGRACPSPYPHSRGD